LGQTQKLLDAVLGGDLVEPIDRRPRSLLDLCLIQQLQKLGQARAGLWRKLQAIAGCAMGQRKISR
jgi:hypothetical protein